MATNSTTRRRTVQPPAQAVAQDAHWAAKLERLRSRTRPTAHVTICDDPTVKQELAQARQALTRAQAIAEADTKDKGAQAALSAAQERLEAAQAAYDAEAITLTFQALDKDALQKLLAEHPPTEEQAEEGYDYNSETLNPVLIAASSVEGISVEDAELFLSTWSKGEADTLTAVVTNIQRDIRMDVGKG
jgi:predicted lipid-binding transport protein (Tim44 family)